jgi:hypothetical protein
MKPIQWVMIFVVASLLHLWMFLHIDLETHPVASWIAIAMQLAICIGPFWMLYDWFVSKSKRTLKSWMWLFFVPWGFLWYYFEKYRLTGTVNE